MLKVESYVGILHYRRLYTTTIASVVVNHMLHGSASFYMEPQPNDEWMIVVDEEHRHILDKFIDTVQGARDE